LGNSPPRAPRKSTRKKAAAQERVFERAMAVHAAAEARNLRRRIDAGQRRAIAVQHA
jgi:hypothetical protein